MSNKTYRIEITGSNDLLMHHDNIEWADRMEAWKNDPSNRKRSKAGDDRSPAFRWLGALYHDNEHIAIPSDALMKCFMQGGASVPVPGGRGNKSFKAQTQSGALIVEPYWKLSINGSLVEIDPLLALMNEEDFEVHKQAAIDRGFSLFVKRASVNNTKHVRVRPRFSNWSAHGTLTVWDKQLTKDIVQQIWDASGQYKGIGNWRPSAPKTPGPFGTFTVKVS